MRAIQAKVYCFSFMAESISTAQSCLSNLNAAEALRASAYRYQRFFSFCSISPISAFIAVMAELLHRCAFSNSNIHDLEQGCQVIFSGFPAVGLLSVSPMSH
jgi:hypothetical protein